MLYAVWNIATPTGEMSVCTKANLKIAFKKWNLKNKML